MCCDNVRFEVWRPYPDAIGTKLAEQVVGQQCVSARVLTQREPIIEEVDVYPGLYSKGLLDQLFSRVSPV